jgi:hypothetical protein
MNENQENVNPLTVDICNAIIIDLKGHSNHFLQVDGILAKHLDKIRCICPGCIKIKKEVIELLQTLHNEVVFERMRDTLYVTRDMKLFATMIVDKSLKSENCFWNRNT